MSKLVSGIISKLATLEIWTAGLLFVLMILMNLAEIISRTLFQYSIYWVQEATILFAVWMIFLTAAYLFAKNGLINIDYVLNKFPNRVQNYIGILNDILIGIFLYFIIFYGIKLQIVQSITTSYALNVPSNLFSLSLVVCGISMAITLLNDFATRLMRLGKAERT